MSPSHRKSGQVNARPGQTESQVDPGVQLACTCDSVWPGLNACSRRCCAPHVGKQSSSNFVVFSVRVKAPIYLGPSLALWVALTKKQRTINFLSAFRSMKRIKDMPAVLEGCGRGGKLCLT